MSIAAMHSPSNGGFAIAVDPGAQGVATSRNLEDTIVDCQNECDHSKKPLVGFWTTDSAHKRVRTVMKTGICGLVE